MLNKLKELREANEEGFTLIELLVVIVIIGILAAIALPIFLNQQKAAIQAGVKADVKAVQTSVATFLVKKPTATAAELTALGYTKSSASPASDAETAVAVSGDWKSYKIVGSNVNAGGTAATTTPVAPANPFRFEYDSATGKYQTFSNGGTTAD